MLDNFEYIAILGARDPISREYFSNLVGKKESQKRSISNGNNGTTHTYSDTREYIIQPEEFDNLGDKLVLSYSGNHLILHKDFYYERKNQ